MTRYFATYTLGGCQFGMEFEAPDVNSNGRDLTEAELAPLFAAAKREHDRISVSFHDRGGVPLPVPAVFSAPAWSALFSTRRTKALWCAAAPRALVASQDQ